MPKFISSTNESVNQSAQNAVAAAKATKSTFQTSRFRPGMVLEVVGYDFWVNADDPSKAFPVLTTRLNGTDFDPIWLSNLCRSVTDAKTGKELTPAGALNTEAQRLMDDVAIATDEDVLNALVEWCKGKTIKVKRDRTYTRMFSNGNLSVSTILEFTV